MSENPKSKAREFAVQFLYQSESEKILYFSESHFLAFVQNFQVPSELVPAMREMSRGTLEYLSEVDRQLQETSSNWKLGRMAATDRNILRLATYELLRATAPHKVILNEAIELAKKFGTAESGAFVNGLLDRLARTLVATDK